MTEEQNNQDQAPLLDVPPPPVEMEQPAASAEALAAAEAALGTIKERTFAGRNLSFGKMVNCQFCGQRHRTVDVTYREHFDAQGKKTVTVIPVRVEKCQQNFRQMWVDEDLDTGELSIQYATVPTPQQIERAAKMGVKLGAKPILGAAMFAKKRRNRHPNKTGLQVVEVTRQLMQYVNPERFTEDQSKMLEARRMAVNTLRNRRERAAKRVRQQQRESRRINRWT